MVLGKRLGGPRTSKNCQKELLIIGSQVRALVRPPNHEVTSIAYKIEEFLVLQRDYSGHDRVTTQPSSHTHEPD